MRSMMLAAVVCLTLAPVAATAQTAPEKPAKPAPESRAAAAAKKPAARPKTAAKAPAKPRAAKHVLVYADNGVPGYKDTPIQPWSGYHVHDPGRAEPKIVDPGQMSTPERPGTAPSDAVVLFDGHDMSQWVPAPEWTVKDGLLVAGVGNLASKEEFGDCQVHLEWQPPADYEGRPFNRGNNGVQFLKAIEVQIFDSYSQKIYPDGQAGSIYGQTPPLVNAMRKPGQWQTYDILFIAPKFKDGKLAEPARITVLHNGVLVQYNQEIYGSTPHSNVGSYEGLLATGPLSLMGHHCPVKFRNIWVRRLDNK